MSRGRSFHRVSAYLCVPDCKICSSVKHDVTLFIKGTPDEYVQQVAQYRNETIILENARSLKECVDAKFTEDDQTNAINVLVGPALCVHLPGRPGGLLGVGWGATHFSSPPSPFPGNPEREKLHGWGSGEGGVGKTQPRPRAFWPARLLKCCPATSLGAGRPSCVLGIAWPQCQALSAGLPDSSLSSV